MKPLILLAFGTLIVVDATTYREIRGGPPHWLSSAATLADRGNR